MAVSSAVINFNSGMVGLREIFPSIGFASGKYLDKSATLKDMARLKNADQKDEKPVKDRRKKLRSIKKGYIVITQEKEAGHSYSAGSFLYFMLILYFIFTSSLFFSVSNV